MKIYKTLPENVRVLADQYQKDYQAANDYYHTDCDWSARYADKLYMARNKSLQATVEAIVQHNSALKPYEYKEKYIDSAQLWKELEQSATVDDLPEWL